MRLDINLATNPYEDARKFWLRWGTGLVAATILTLALVTITITGWFAAQRDHAAIAQYKEEIARRDTMRRRAEAYLNQPENRATRDQSEFLNGLIERKSLSWTHVLEDLEKVMPARVHLISIHPQLDEDNQLSLKMVVGGDSREKAIELARRMEESGRFAQTYIEAETAAPSGSGDSVQISIVGLYIPNTMPEAAPSPKGSTKPETTKRSAS
jgi:type IV pilus assembly protein PilN